MLFVLQVGCPWRDIHERHGKWNSVYVRFQCWVEQSVWEALLETLVELGPTDDWQHMIDSTRFLGHSHAAGTEGDRSPRLWSKPRLLYVEDPRPLRRSGTPSRLRADGRPGLGLQGSSRLSRPAGWQVVPLLADKGTTVKTFINSRSWRGSCPRPTAARQRSATTASTKIAAALSAT